MENTSLLIWFIVIALIATLGLSSMIQAYWGSGSLAVLFPDPIAPNPVPTLNPEAATQFQQGCEAYQLKQYRRASDRFTTATQLDPTFSEAFHNLGLITANLRQDNAAAQHLLQAGERYLEQSNTEGYTQVKQALEQLKERKQAKETVPS
jgi:thioredoxin-like negative regulator of GroEL